LENLALRQQLTYEQNAVVRAEAIQEIVQLPRRCERGFVENV
jgi:hypothetical protein